MILTVSHLPQSGVFFGLSVLGLDDEWFETHSKALDVSYTAEQWASAGWGFEEFCEEGGLLSPCESFLPSLAREFLSRCSNAFIVGLVLAAKKEVELSSASSLENPIEIE